MLDLRGGVESLPVDPTEFGNRIEGNAAFLTDTTP